MKLIKPSFSILTSEADIELATRDIELAARTCYKSEAKIHKGSDLELIHKLIDRRHEAMLEFGPSITVKFICDRGVSHELVRHRIASFAQESTRYCNYSSDHITFIIPLWTRFEEGKPPNRSQNDHNPEWMWLDVMYKAEEYYNMLIAFGWSPQQARSVLPNSLKTEINIKANIREWRHIFRLRCSNKAHPQMQEIMNPLLAKLKTIVPVVFEDL